MTQSYNRIIGSIGVAALVAGTLLVAPAAQAAVGPDVAVVINEVYGGGGSAGAVRTNDFIELYNTTDDAVDLAGWSVQYTIRDWGRVVRLDTPVRFDPAGEPLPGLRSVRRRGGGATAEPGRLGQHQPEPNGRQGRPRQQFRELDLCQSRPVRRTLLSSTLVGYGSGERRRRRPHRPLRVEHHVDLPECRPHQHREQRRRLHRRDPEPRGTPACCPQTRRSGGQDDRRDPGRWRRLAVPGDHAVTTTGVVTAAYPTGGFNGYVIQTAGTGGVGRPSAHRVRRHLRVFSGDRRGPPTSVTWLRSPVWSASTSASPRSRRPLQAGVTVLDADATPIATGRRRLAGDRGATRVPGVDAVPAHG